MAGPYRPKPSGPRPQNTRRPDNRQQKDEFELRINEEISAPQVRLVGDNIPEQGIYPLSKAIRLADDLELDLVEISARQIHLCVGLWTTRSMSISRRKRQRR